jgi:hypothetical protein
MINGWNSDNPCILGTSTKHKTEMSTSDIVENFAKIDHKLKNIHISIKLNVTYIHINMKNISLYMLIM